MKTCLTCHKQFNSEPFRIHSNGGGYCAMECLPEGILDEPYAFTYASQMEHYIDLASNRMEFDNTTERDDRLAEIEYLATQSAEYVLGDEGVNFFQDELRDLHSEVANLYDTVANYFLDKENYIYIDGLYISWEKMPPTVAVSLQHTLQNIIDEQCWRPSINYNQSLDPTTESHNIIMFPDEYFAAEVKLNQLYEAGLRYLQSQRQALENEINDIFFYMEMAFCPICTWPEPFEDFNINEAFQAYVCSGSCSSKKRRNFP